MRREVVFVSKFCARVSALVSSAEELIVFASSARRVSGFEGLSSW